MELPDELRVLVERVGGPVVGVVDRSWPHAVTGVWQATHASGEISWVKRHSQTRKYDQELHAYLVWVPALAEAGVSAPSLVARDAASRALILSHLPGEPAPAEDPELHRQAGRALAVLHGLPFVDHDRLSVREAVLARLARWTAEAEGLVPREVVARVTEEVGDAHAFAGGRRVPCHRDFSPRNWLVDGGRLGILDFEHAGPDLRWVDALKLADASWDAPGTRAAFREGYGRDLSDLDRERFRLLLWLHALSTWVWSANHQDAAYEAHARRLLNRLRSGWSPLVG